MPEKLYIVCRQCDDAFGNLESALSHVGSCGSYQGFDIEPESVVFQ